MARTPQTVFLWANSATFCVLDASSEFYYFYNFLGLRMICLGFSTFWFSPDFSYILEREKLREKMCYFIFTTISEGIDFLPLKARSQKRNILFFMRGTVMPIIKAHIRPPRKGKKYIFYERQSWTHRFFFHER